MECKGKMGTLNQWDVEQFSVNPDIASKASFVKIFNQVFAKGFATRTTSNSKKLLVGMIQIIALQILIGQDITAVQY